jgi:hypothetical protein
LLRRAMYQIDMVSWDLYGRYSAVVQRPGTHEAAIREIL